MATSTYGYPAADELRFKTGTAHAEPDVLTPDEHAQLRELGEELSNLREDQVHDAMDAVDRTNPSSGLRQIHALIAAIHQAMTDVGINQSENYTDMRVTQRGDYGNQESAYKRKAYLSLIGVAGGVFMIASAFNIGDGLKKAMEALSKVPAPVATTLTTVQDGHIHGGLAYEVTKIGSVMEEQRTERQRSETVDQKVADATSQMMQLLSRLSSACIGAAG